MWLTCDRWNREVPGWRPSFRHESSLCYSLPHWFVRDLDRNSRQARPGVQPV
jgi:hypothetical protein